MEPHTTTTTLWLDGAIRTAKGPRTTNEDAGFASTSSLLVADGVGGAPAGEHASALACTTVADELRRLAPDVHAVGDSLAAAFSVAHDALVRHCIDHPNHDGLATTLSAVVLTGDAGAARAVAAWVGDSPIWHLPGGDGAPMVRIGGERSGELGVLSSWLSSAGSHRPRLASVAVAPGDWLLVASDGIDVLGEEQVASILAALGPDAGPVEAAEALLAAAEDVGLVDNITIAVGRIAVPGPEPMSPTARLRTMSLADAILRSPSVPVGRGWRRGRGGEGSA